jgi:signal peptide peptidase SppA
MTGLIQELTSGFWMIDKASAQSYIHLVANLLKGNISIDPNLDLAAERQKNLPRFISFANNTYNISNYGESPSPEDAPKGSIALLSIHGPITYYDQFCGPSGMATKASIIERIGANKNIKALVLEVRSGGGEGYASDKFVRAIKELNIPVIAFVEDMAASAAYQIISACDWIVANTSQARIGSIGTYVTLADFEEALKMEGIKLFEVYATKSKDKNQDYYQALKGNTDAILETVNFWNEAFLSGIKENRSGKLGDEKIWGTGKMFFAEDALNEGLIDEISSFKDMIKSIENSLTL